MKIYVETTGGLANQLFQWSAGEILRAKHDGEIVIDSRIPDRPWERGLQVDRIIPGLTVRHTPRVIRSFWGLSHRLGRRHNAVMKRASLALPRSGVLARDFAHADSVAATGRDVRLRGFFQEPVRLRQHRDVVAPIVMQGLTSFSKTEQVEAATRAPYAAMHVRRGDYVSVPEYANRFGACTPRYFRAALERIDPQLQVLVATDDPDWVEREFVDLAPRLTTLRGGNHFQDLAVLAGARELVLSNSTFSWWAAYAGSPARVICPDPWFNDSSSDFGLAEGPWVKVARD